MIEFRNWSKIPVIKADGPEDSPHRYEDGSLCVWYPRDPLEARWVLEDGLDALLGLTAAHLFRENWWREYRVWPGLEAPHAPSSPKLRKGDE